jgi:hypothetical protein
MHEQRGTSGLLRQCVYADSFPNICINISFGLADPWKILPFDHLAVDNVFADM